jgi:hypothetical protein
MNFKSRVPPHREVEFVSGIECQMFRPRPAGERKRGDGK